MKLLTEIKAIKSGYEGGTIEITDGLPFSQYSTLRTIEFYSNSKFTGSRGNKLPNGREKPFYNIVNTMVDTAVVATDIDTKDIRVESEREQDFDKSFLYNHEIQKWMKESNFAKTLNEMGETRARYGGVLVKKTEEEKGKMELQVVQWKNVITDPVCLEEGVIIEKHYLSPMQLRKKKEVWENVDEAIKLFAKKGYTNADTKCEIWEVHGEFPESYCDEDGECVMKEGEEYYNQVHFYAVKGEKYVHLYWEEEKEMPYKYLAWKKASGRSLGRGVVEEGEESQVWTNDAVEKEQAAMELSGKVIMKTNSKKIGNNLMTDMENGSIVVLEDGKELEVLNLLTGALPQFQNLIQKWWSQYERVTSSYDAVRGETPPSGQPYRLQALVSQNGSSHFDYRREEWGIFLTELFVDWVFPYVAKKINKKHILASDFSPEELKNLDEQYSKYAASDFAKEKILSGELITLEDYLSLQGQFMEVVGKTGRRRFLDIPDGYYKDMEAKLTINVTGEQKNKMAAMESLNTIFTTVAGTFNPNTGKYAALEDPVLMSILNKIIEMSGSGLSPISLTKQGNQQQQGQPTTPALPPATPSPLGQAEIRSRQPQAVTS